MWNQIYNPLGNAALSTIAAAVPVVTLLVLIASGKVKAHIAAIIAVIADQPDRDLHLHDAGGHVDPRLAARRRCRVLPDRLDRAERHLSLPAHGCDRPIRIVEARGRRRHRGPAPATVADRVFVRRVLRGRFRLRYAGGHHRLGPDRPRLLAARRLRPVADRQYRAGGLWRARYADPGPRLGHRAGSLHPRRDGRPATAGVLADRAVLGGLGLRRLARHEGGLAGHSGDRPFVRDPAIRDLELHQSLDRRYRRLADLDGLPDPVPQGVATQALWLSAALRGRDEFGGDHDRAESHGQDAADPEPALERVVAVDHRLRRDADLGQWRVQDLGELDLHLELSRFPICTT